MSSLASRETFLSLIEKNKGIIYKVSNSYCRDVEDRKDLVQEIIIQLWKSFSKYDDRYKLSTWMYRIALNTSISFYRKEHRRKESSLPLTDNMLNVAEGNDQGELEGNIKILHRCIDQLDALNRAIMILYLDDHSYKEIAEIVGITETNVATKINRIKQKLKHHFSTVQSE